MITAKQARDKDFVVNWRNNKEAAELFEDFKTDALEEIEKEIKRVVIREEGQILYYSLYQFLELFDKSYSDDRALSAQLQKDFKLALCSKLRDLGYSVESEVGILEIKWGEKQ